MIFLAIDADTLRLPGFDASSVWYLTYALLAAVVFLLFLHWRQKKDLAREALSNRFMQVLMKHELTHTQQTTIQNFFNSLNDNERAAILSSQKNLAYYLHAYLETHETINAIDRVQIYDKLLSELQSQTEIKSMADLCAGELCALILDGREYFATVAKTNTTQALLSLHQHFSHAPQTKINLYAYRPHLGGFTLGGKILKANDHSVVIEHDGQIQFQSDQHLMTTSPLTIHLERWPKDGIGIESSTTDAPSEGIDAFSGTTEKFSDRAFIVRLQENLPDWVLKRQDLWQFQLALPEGALTCRVRMAHYNANNLYLLRPIDLTQADRRRLDKFIAENNPIHEHI
ncbi:MAG TPA: hypothetical protein PLY93_05360 [Turneriella sp.]|nr:hypothetical protein [Turneriella sp.]